MNKLQKTKLLTLGKYKLLKAIISNKYCFDKKDNTFLISNRKIAAKIKVSPSCIDQLMRKLKAMGLIKPVINIFNDKVLMLDPEYLFFSHKEEKPFCIAMYTLGSHAFASQWREYCKEHHTVINARTGKVINISRSTIDNYSYSYNFHDRCYRKGEVSKTDSAEYSLLDTSPESP